MPHGMEQHPSNGGQGQSKLPVISQCFGQFQASLQRDLPVRMPQRHLHPTGAPAKAHDQPLIALLLSIGQTQLQCL